MNSIRKKTVFLVLMLAVCFCLNAAEDLGQVGEIRIVSERTSSQANGTGAVSKEITEEEIEVYHPENTGKLLDKLSSVSADSYGSLGSEQSANIMGMGSSRTLVFINGASAVSAHDGTFDFSVLSPFLIERLEVITSGTGRNGKSAPGGVINIVTKTADEKDPVFRIQAENGSYIPETGRTESLLDSQRINIMFSKRYDNMGIVVDAGITKADNNYTYILDGAKYVREGAQTAGADGSVTVDGKIGNVNAKSFNIFSFRKTGVPGSVTWPSNGMQTTGLISTSNCFSYKNWNFDASYSYSPLQYRDEYGNEKHNKHKAGLGASADFKISDSITINPYLTAGSDFVNSTALDAFRTRILPEAGFSSSFSFGSFSLFPSAGIGYATDIKKFVPKASLGIEIAASRFFTVSADGTYTMNLPSFSDLYWPYTDYGQWFYKGNPNLKPETALSGNLGIKLGNDTLSYDGTAFVKYLWDAIVSSVDYTTKDNLSNSFWYGFDQNVTAKVEFFAANAGWLVNNSFDLSDGKKTTDGVPVYGVRKNTFTLGTSFFVKNVTFSTDGKFLSPRNLTSENWLFLVNAGIDWKASDSCSFYLRADNVLNSRYEYVSGYPMPGIKIRIGGNWNIK